MGYFVMFLGFAAVFVFLVIGIFDLFKKNGRAKKSFLAVLVSFIVMIIGIVMVPKEDDNADSSDDNTKTSEVSKKDSSSKKESNNEYDSNSKENKENEEEADKAKDKLINDIEKYGKDKNVDHVLIRNGDVQVYMVDGTEDMSVDEFKQLAKDIYDKSAELGHQDEFGVYNMKFFVNGSQIIARIDSDTNEVTMLGE